MLWLLPNHYLFLLFLSIPSNSFSQPCTGASLAHKLKSARCLTRGRNFSAAIKLKTKQEVLPAARSSSRRSPPSRGRLTQISFATFAVRRHISDGRIFLCCSRCVVFLEASFPESCGSRSFWRGPRLITLMTGLARGEAVANPLCV